MSAARPAFAGVVLAAGASRRMGRPKQLLPLGGRPLLQHVVEAAAAAALAETVVVLGHAAEEIRRALTWPSRCRVVVNPEHAEGQGGSLRAGLAALGGDVGAAVVLLGDQPDVTPGLIDGLTESFRSGADRALRPVYVRGDGTRVPGHPVVLGRELWPALARLAGDEGARGLFAAHPDWLREVPLATPPPRDLDDAGDYARALEAWPTALGG
jgi:molybdenum cofactor cytidylyltransferase